MRGGKPALLTSLPLFFEDLKAGAGGESFNEATTYGVKRT